MIFKGRYSGLGTDLIDLSFYRNVTYYDWFLKLIFTVVTLSLIHIFAIKSNLVFVDVIMWNV